MISAIVLAAGTSSRMGVRNKLLLPFKGNTFIEHVVNQLLQSKVDEVIVVLGHEKDTVKQVLIQKELIFTINSNYNLGMTSSIQAGIKATSKNTDGYLICLSDMPFLITTDYNKILASVSGNKEIILPFYKHQKGNPVYFSKDFREEILKHIAPEGCKGIVQNNKKFLKKILFDNTHILKDIDTEEEFLEINIS